MALFRVESLVPCARHMAAKHGIEKTPQEWSDWVQEFIAKYRERHGLHNETDAQIWERIRKMVGVDE
jgi:hypothetical protein